ncbi:MAG: benzoate-CoA ligase family protein [Candidatus Tectomicrobia bacterium]|nr:benzoate-CoA ligase family protein [Candidatus Tectomicrobia bacterium]
MDTHSSLELPEQFNAAVPLVDGNVAQGRGEKVAIHYQGGTFTYRQLQVMINKTGNALRHLGIEMENRVLMIVLDCPEFIASFLGAIKIGAVPIPTNTIMRSRDYQYFLNDSRAMALIIDQQLLPEVEPVLANCPFLKHVIVIGDTTGKYHSYEKLVEPESESLEAAPTHRDDMALWQYSSGSTGFPKGVVHLQHDMYHSYNTFGKYIVETKESDLVFSVAKLFFAYGLGNSLYFPFSVGASSILWPARPLPEDMFKIIDKFKPTVLFNVPTMYGQMLQVKGAEKYDLSSLRILFSAGESLPPELFRQWKERFGHELIDGIGSTEVIHLFISNKLGSAKAGTSGKIIPGYEARVADDQGNDVPKGEVGNLWVSGDSTAPYYWNKHQKTKTTMIGEWVITGDKYYIDEEDYYVYCGRSDDMLKVGGIWVSPIEIENCLMEHPSVLECAVIGEEDDANLIKPKAFIVLKEGVQPGPTLEQAYTEHIRARLAHYKYPRWYEFVPELPKTATGKIQRYKLRQLSSA